MKKFLFAFLISSIFFMNSVNAAEIGARQEHKLFNEETGKIELPSVFIDEDGDEITLESKPGQYLAFVLLKKKYTNEKCQKRRQAILEKINEISKNAVSSGNQTIARDIDKFLAGRF